VLAAVVLERVVVVVAAVEAIGCFQYHYGFVPAVVIAALAVVVVASAVTATGFDSLVGDVVTTTSAAEESKPLAVTAEATTTTIGVAASTETTTTPTPTPTSTPTPTPTSPLQLRWMYENALNLQASCPGRVPVTLFLFVT